MVQNQSVRPSQFILSYGAGSIVITRGLARVIRSYNDWTLHPAMKNGLTETEIRDENASALLEGGRIFRLPANADFSIPDDTTLVTCLNVFPHWALCTDHDLLFALTDGGNSRCPKCKTGTGKFTQIRFIAACPVGHMSDVNWPWAVHSKHKGCTESVFEWKETGTSTSNTTITCPTCGDEVTLQQVFRMSHGCSGLFPETGLRDACSQRANVVLLTASNLRIADVVTTLTIPPRSNALYRMLRDPRIEPVMILSGTKAEFMANLKKVAGPMKISPVTISELEATDEPDLQAAFKRIKADQGNMPTPESVRRREFEELQNAAANGAPPAPTKIRETFVVRKENVSCVRLPSGTELRVAPVEELSVVMAQRGYTRQVGQSQQAVRPVNAFYRDGNDRWYPGIELFGEGVFVDLKPGQKLALSGVGEAWKREMDSAGSSELDPVQVWWHTHSHRINTAQGVESGYSSTAIRERVYSLQKGDGTTLGGVLLYTAQQGGDGSLGGLIALAPEFQRVVDAALRGINGCSNDPLCAEDDFAHGKLNGAACYACLLVSETSCETSNLFLDRNLLRTSV